MPSIEVLSMPSIEVQSMPRIEEFKLPSKAMSKAKILDSEREVIVKKRKKSNLTARHKSKKISIDTNRSLINKKESQDIGEKTIQLLKNMSKEEPLLQEQTFEAQDDKEIIYESIQTEPLETMMSSLTVKEIPKEFVKRDNIFEDYSMHTIIQTNMSIPIRHVRIDTEEAQ